MGVRPHRRRVGEHATVTLAQAEAQLTSDLNQRYAPPVLNVGLSFNQKQLDTLTSFVYNLGPGPLAGARSATRCAARVGSTRRRRRCSGTTRPVWKALPGLTRRRQWERQLFLGGTYAVWLCSPADGGPVRLV
jgi:GH24 family phage-related lysozyme (muramidase)